MCWTIAVQHASVSGCSASASAAKTTVLWAAQHTNMSSGIEIGHSMGMSHSAEGPPEPPCPEPRAASDPLEELAPCGSSVTDASHDHEASALTTIANRAAN